MTGNGDEPYEMPRTKSDLARVALRAEKEAARRRAAWEGRTPVQRRAPKRRRAGNSAVPLHAVISELFADVIRDVAGGGLPALVAAWDNLAGPFASYMMPTSFDPATGTLSVRAGSTAWATNMRLLAPKFLSRVNERLGSDQVRRLRISAPTASVRTPAKRLAVSVAPELEAVLDRQLRVACREPEEVFQAGLEARARPARTVPHAIIVRSRAQAKARQRTASPVARGPYGNQAGPSGGSANAKGEGSGG
ncbi:DUF721 domain-containing protein (plasmid) [Streptomyces canus]|uniref:DUF721 domain-containing protein n=1 Tax=Streptomyces canus TaxID=58343 RepID=UPI002F91AA03|nr:DUF721 domain-containing protein [Streptomyces canus]